MSFRRAGTVLLLKVLLLPPVALMAQAVRGKVSEQESGIPVSGAVVQLLADDGRVSGGTLTDRSGGYLVEAPAPGRYRLRVDRIGFQSATTEVLDLAYGTVTDHAIAVTSQPISLVGVIARGRSRGCSVGRDAETLSRVWEETRKALNVVALSQSADLVRFDTESFLREVDPRSGGVRWEDRSAAFGRTENPFRSLPITQLEEHGYIRMFPDSTLFYAPDAQALLSDTFLQGHCFQLAAAADDPGLIGLSFRPAKRPSRPDIEGTLWLDRASAELRYLEYHYVAYQLPLSSDRFGGRIDFERLPSGAWIVGRWVIRMPVMAERRFRFNRPGNRGVTERSERELTAIWEEGGEVVAVATTPDSSRAQRGIANLSGMVVDSLTGRPLAQAVVYISGTSFADTTDATGHYEIHGAPAGRRIVSFSHPRLETLGVTPSPSAVELAASQAATVQLAVPAAATLLRRYCPAAGSINPGMAIPEVKGGGMVVGFVRSDDGGAPAPNARVTLAWTAASQLHAGSIQRSVGPNGVTGELQNASEETMAASIEVATDATGFYRGCGVPLDLAVDVEVTIGGQSWQRRVPPRHEPIRVHNIRIDPR